MRVDRMAFDSTLSVDNLVIHVDEVGGMNEAEIDRMIDSFNQYGWSLLQCSPRSTAKENLLSLTQYFGNVVRHNRSDSYGITAIEHDPESDDANTYLSASFVAHPPHTGGTAQAVPPKVVALFCELPSSSGGFSQVISGKAIYDHVRENDPEGLSRASKENALIVERAGEKASRAIFAQQDSGLLSIAYRSDNVAITNVAPGLDDTFALMREFINHPKSQVIFKLEKGQLCIFDNTAVLHGRTAFDRDSKRRLCRLNMDGNSSTRRKIIYGFSGS